MSSLILSQPAGLWALLGLPVVVIIHCLQQKARRVRVSTLFLLEKVAPQSAEGSRLQRFRQSVPFWMQIASVFLIAWLLTEPRWVMPQSVQHVAVVLDASASNAVFKAENRTLLLQALGKWERMAATTHWHVLSSQPRAPALYSGTDQSAALAAYDSFRPMSVTHDPTEVLANARTLLRGGNGGMIFVTDHETDVPDQVAVLSGGEPFDNVGISGVTVWDEKGRTKWRALVRCTGKSAQSRDWHVAWVTKDGDEQKTASTRLDIGAGKLVQFTGELPLGVSQARIVMSADRFTLDDTAPVQAPSHVPMRVRVAVGGESGDLIRRMLTALPDIVMGGNAADMTVAETGTPVETDALFVAPSDPPDAVLDPGHVVAENHPLVSDVSWSGLISAKPPKMVLLEEDIPLLWRSGQPLAFQRQTRNSNGQAVNQLFLQWDLVKSNASRLPAALVLLHRWIEARDRARVLERTGNYEAGQRLEVPLPPGKSLQDLVLSANGKTLPWTGSLTEEPGFFQVQLGAQTLVRGAAVFADAREGDFTICAPADTTDGFISAAGKQNSEADALTSVWILALLGCLLTAWGWGSRTTR